MTITTSRTGVVIEAIVAKLNALAIPNVNIYDGPVLYGNVMWQQAVFVGFDGFWEGNFEGATIDQTMPYIGVTTMQEELEIHCAAEAWSGDPTWSTLRDTALTLMAAVEDVLRTDPSLGIDGTTIARFQVGSLYQLPSGTWGPSQSTGSLARVTFTVHVQTTLMTV